MKKQLLTVAILLCVGAPKLQAWCIYNQTGQQLNISAYKEAFTRNIGGATPGILSTPPWKVWSKKIPAGQTRCRNWKNYMSKYMRGQPKNFQKRTGTKIYVEVDQVSLNKANPAALKKQPLTYAWNWGVWMPIGGWLVIRIDSKTNQVEYYVGVPKTEKGGERAVAVTPNYRKTPTGGKFTKK